MATWYKEESFCRYGIKSDGVMEIKFHNPKKRNAFSADTQRVMIKAFKEAN